MRKKFFGRTKKRSKTICQCRPEQWETHMFYFLINMHHLGTSLKIYRSHLGNAMLRVNIQKTWFFGNLTFRHSDPILHAGANICKFFNLFESYLNLYIWYVAFYFKEYKEIEILKKIVFLVPYRGFLFNFDSV